VSTTGRAQAPKAQDDTVKPRFLLEWGKRGEKPGEFHFPIGLALNRAGEVFVTDHYNSRVQKFNGDGKLLACFPVLRNPGGIAVDAESKLYISHFPGSRLGKNATPDRISVYKSDGTFLFEWGKSGSGAGELSWPGGIALGKNGRVYVADQTNRRVQVFDAKGKFLFMWGEYGTKPGQFGGNTSPKSRVGGPQFVAIDSAGNIYTTEGSVGRVQKFTADGKFLMAWGDNDDKPGSFGGLFAPIKGNLKGPIGICIDRKDRIWVSAVSGRVQQFTKDGKYLGGIGGKQGSGPGEFLAPHGVAVDGRAHLYVVDAYNHRVQKFVVPK
jgi:DNA-binding beta-propeller fold protein YncE